MRMTAFLEEWDMTVTDKLDQVTFEVMACLTVKNGADYRDLSILFICYTVENNASTITLWITRFLLLVVDNKPQVIRFNQVIS